MLKEQEELLKNDYKSVVYAGCIITYKNITLCDLTDHVPFMRNRPSEYQVHSDNSKVKFSDVYKNIDEAVEKFIELKLQAME
jgi:hypothetical protein